MNSPPLSYDSCPRQTHKVKIANRADGSQYPLKNP